MKLRGHEVDLSNIGCVVLDVLGKSDYVVPPFQTEATIVLAYRPDKESASLDAGNVGMLVGRWQRAASGPVSGIGSSSALTNRRVSSEREPSD